MGQDTVVRRAQPDDIDEIYQVMRRSRQEAFTGLLPPEALTWESEIPDEFCEFIKEIISHEQKAQLVAVCDEAVVGLAELVWQSKETQDFVEESEAELKAIHVRPESLNEGIGTELLHKAVDVLPSHLSGVALCVLSGNERARSFYERRGFEQDGTTINTTADDECIEAVYRRPL
ncbi:GNAT family N-acetyltransferase [Halopelagius fulvigenes]|uniref:GNAT family N-acetyltransferase n=1 Tax=Halopelagius fulvigenes TaxID=1198324 RepID=A0ABD5U248_9EURY